MTATTRRIAIGIAAGIVVLGLVAMAGFIYVVTFSPDRSRYPIRGVDVSGHQGVIDWRRVAASDVSFAIIKASEGGDYADPQFAGNLANARAAGLAVGAYHFFTLCRPGAEQAANFLARVGDTSGLLPPAVDLEYEGNCKARPPAQKVRTELDAFLAPVEAAFGKRAILYVTYGFYTDYYASLPKRPLWTRWLAWTPAVADWLIWQYQDRGHVDGIAGDVDLNVLNGDAKVLAGLRAVPAS